MLYCQLPATHCYVFVFMISLEYRLLEHNKAINMTIIPGGHTRHRPLFPLLASKIAFWSVIMP